MMYRKTSDRVPPPATDHQPVLQDLSHHMTTPTKSSASASHSSLFNGGDTTKQGKLSPNKLLVFCDIVLKHVNYPQAFREPSEERGTSSSEESKSAILVKNERISESPLNSVGESARESTRSSTSSNDSSVLAELDPDEVDKETFENVSCWCGKPFAGRPMIECDMCLIWFHMSCEQVRRKNIPQRFHCSRCKDARRRKKRPAPKENSTGRGGKRKRMTSTSRVATTTKAIIPDASMDVSAPEIFPSQAELRQEELSPPQDGRRRRRSSAESAKKKIKGMSNDSNWNPATESLPARRKSNGSKDKEKIPKDIVIKVKDEIKEEVVDVEMVNPTTTTVTSSTSTTVAGEGERERGQKSKRASQKRRSKSGDDKGEKQIPASGPSVDGVVAPPPGPDPKPKNGEEQSLAVPPELLQPRRLVLETKMNEGRENGEKDNESGGQQGIKLEIDDATAVGNQLPPVLPCYRKVAYTPTSICVKQEMEGDKDESKDMLTATSGSTVDERDSASSDIRSNISITLPVLHPQVPDIKVTPPTPCTTPSHITTISSTPPPPYFPDHHFGPLSRHSSHHHYYNQKRDRDYRDRDRDRDRDRGRERHPSNPHRDRDRERERHGHRRHHQGHAHAHGYHRHSSHHHHHRQHKPSSGHGRHHTTSSMMSNGSSHHGNHRL